MIRTVIAAFTPTAVDLEHQLIAWGVVFVVFCLGLLIVLLVHGSYDRAKSYVFHLRQSNVVDIAERRRLNAIITGRVIH